MTLTKLKGEKFTMSTVIENKKKNFKEKFRQITRAFFEGVYRFPNNELD